MYKISEFFASIGFKVEDQGLKTFENRLNGIRNNSMRVRIELEKLNAIMRRTGQVKGALGKVSTAQGATSAAKATANLNASAETGAAKIAHYTGRINRLANAMARLANEASRVKLPSGNIRVRGEGRGVSGGRRGPSGGGGLSPLGFLGFNNAFIRNMLPFAGASLAAAIIRSTIRAGERMMGSEISVRAVAGGPAAGQQNWQFVNNISRELALPLLEAADQFAKLSSAAQGTALQGAPIRDIFQSISEFGKARMVEPERLNLAIRAVGQMINKQQVMAEELKSQFGEHLPGAMQLAAKAMGFLKENGEADVAALFKAVEAGEVMADDFLPKLAKVMAETAREGGALEKALKMSSNERQRAFNEFTIVSAKLFKAIDGPLANFWRQIAGIVQAIDASKIGNILTVVASPLLLVARLLGHFNSNLNGSAKAIIAVSAGLAALILHTRIYAAVMTLAANAQRLFGLAVAFLTAPMFLLTVGLIGLALGLDHLLTLVKRGELDLSYLGDAITDFFKGIWNGIIDLVNHVTRGHIKGFLDKAKMKYNYEINAENSAKNRQKLGRMGYGVGSVPLMDNIPANMYNNNAKQTFNMFTDVTVEGNADKDTVKDLSSLTEAALFSYLSVPKV